MGQIHALPTKNCLGKTRGNVTQNWLCWRSCACHANIQEPGFSRRTVPLPSSVNVLIALLTLIECLHFTSPDASTPLHLRGLYLAFHSALPVWQLSLLFTFQITVCILLFDHWKPCSSRSVDFECLWRLKDNFSYMCSEKATPTWAK